jgi:hypothetical protein
MVEHFELTSAPQFISGTKGDPSVQPIYDAVDVSFYSRIDLTLYVSNFNNLISTNLTIGIRTGSHLESEDGWVSLLLFPTVYRNGQSFKVSNIDNHQRFIRWSKVVLGTAPAVFRIVGTGYVAQGCHP